MLHITRSACGYYKYATTPEFIVMGRYVFGSAKFKIGLLQHRRIGNIIISPVHACMHSYQSFTSPSLEMIRFIHDSPMYECCISILSGPTDEVSYEQLKTFLDGIY